MSIQRKMHKKTLLGLVLMVPLLLGQSCSDTFRAGLGQNPGASQQAPGGMWYSGDKGDSWEQRVFVRDGEQGAITIAGNSIRSLQFHPTDSRVLYANTNNGIYMTDNAGEQWHLIREGGFVDAIAPDPNNASVIYVATENRITKTIDRGENWEDKYIESRGGIGVQRAAVDPITSSRIYITNSAGDLILSTDAGTSWKTIWGFGTEVKQLLINPLNRNALYVATGNQGIWVSTDRGATWNDTRESMREFGRAHEHRKLIIDESRPSTLLYASAYGLLWTFDNGQSWKKVEMVSPPGSVNIRAVALNPVDPNEMYYANESVFYKTTNGGANWISSTLPAGHLPTNLIVDFFDANNLYMSVELPPKKKRQLIGVPK